MLSILFLLILDGDGIGTDGRSPTEGEMQQLFLPFRAFCACKGVISIILLLVSDLVIKVINVIVTNVTRLTKYIVNL